MRWKCGGNAAEMRWISGGLAKRGKPKTAKTREIHNQYPMDSSSKGIRVEGRGHTPPLCSGRQALGKGRWRFVATNFLRRARGGASPRQLRVEFVATNIAALSRHICTCRNPNQGNPWWPLGGREVRNGRARRPAELLRLARRTRPTPSTIH